jgi:hypothetical protein
MSADLDTDDFADLDFADDVDDADEFADLDEFAEPEPEAPPFEYVPEIIEDDEPDKPARKPRKDEPPKPIISGHCAWPQTKDPHLSHERCANRGSGSRANPAKNFHPCPCPCHLAHDSDGAVLTYECGGCGGILAEAPIFGVDEDGDPVYVHVDRKDRMIYTGVCQ